MEYLLTLTQITEIRSAQDCYFTDEETAACVDEAHKLKKRLCAHARARDSVKMCMSQRYHNVVQSLIDMQAFDTAWM